MDSLGFRTVQRIEPLPPPEPEKPNEEKLEEYICLKIRVIENKMEIVAKEPEIVNKNPMTLLTIFPTIKYKKNIDGTSINSRDDIGSKMTFHQYIKHNNKDLTNLVMVKMPFLMPISNENTFMNEIEFDKDNNKKKNEKQTSVDNAEDEEPTPLTLKNVPEGVIGKLRIHKSGKIQLHIGNFVFDVNQKYMQDVLEVFLKLCQQVYAIKKGEKDHVIERIGEIVSKIQLHPHIFKNN